MVYSQRAQSTHKLVTCLSVILVTLSGATFGRYLLLEQQNVPRRYWWQALGIEFVQVAPFGAIPAGVITWIAMSRAQGRDRRSLKSLLKSNTLSGSESVAVMEAIALLEAERHE